MYLGCTHLQQFRDNIILNLAKYCSNTTSLNSLPSVSIATKVLWEKLLVNKMFQLCIFQKEHVSKMFAKQFKHILLFLIDDQLQNDIDNFLNFTICHCQ